MNIAVIIVNWRSAEHVLKAVAAIKASDHRDRHVFIVDNASGDDSLARLAHLGPSVTLIANTVNTGWAGGCNTGVARAIEQGYDTFFLLNPDAEVRPDTLTQLVKTSAAVGPDAVLGCVAFDDDGSVQYCGDYRDETTGLPVWIEATPIEVEAMPSLVSTFTIIGASMFLTSRLWDVVGSFDERYFMYFEETDWCLRATRAGARLIVVRNAAIDHQGSATVGGMTSPFRCYLFTRNELRFAAQHGTKRQVFALFKRRARLVLGWLTHRVTGRPTEPFITVVARGLGILHFLTGRTGDAPPFIRRTLS